MSEDTTGANDSESVQSTDGQSGGGQDRSEIEKSIYESRSEQRANSQSGEGISVEPDDKGLSTDSSESFRRLWHSESTDAESSDESNSVSQAKPSSPDSHKESLSEQEATASGTSSRRLWNRTSTDSQDQQDDETSVSGRIDAIPSSGEHRKENASDNDDTELEEKSSFSHLLQRSSDTHPSKSTSVETDIETFFDDLEEFDRATSGSQVLVVSPTDHRITDETCSSFLTAGGGGKRNVMFVTTDEAPGDRLQICQNCSEWSGGKVAVVEIGEVSSSSDSVPETIGGNNVLHKRVASPKNLSKIGLLTTRILKQWSQSDQPTVLCFHTLTGISGYLQSEVLFRFLYTLQAKLSSLAVTGHYHIDSTSHDEQEINTLRTMFDLVVRISREGEITVD